MKASKYDPVDDEDTDVAYLEKRIVRVINKSGQFQRRGNSEKWKDCWGLSQMWKSWAFYYGLSNTQNRLSRISQDWRWQEKE